MEPAQRKGTTNVQARFKMRGTRIRLAQPADIPELRRLIDVSVRGLQARDYTPAQIEGALATVYGVDTQLIADGTYFVVEALAPVIAESHPSREVAETRAANESWTIAGCGGWSKRKTLFGGDQVAGREDSLLDPRVDAAKIRAFFIHPAWARRGLGSLILDACENAARAAGFTRLEMGATLTGVPFYRARGYEVLEELSVPLAEGESMAIVKMGKRL